MAKKPQTLSELKTIWYKKLKDEGFEDAEPDEHSLKLYHQTIFRRKSVDTHHGGWQAKAAYYQMADQFLVEHEFSSELEKIIWEYHANAVTVRGIADTLNKVRADKTNRQAVWRVVRRLETIMKSRYLVGYMQDEQ